MRRDHILCSVRAGLAESPESLVTDVTACAGSELLSPHLTQWAPLCCTQPGPVPTLCSGTAVVKSTEVREGTLKLFFLEGANLIVLSTDQELISAAMRAGSFFQVCTGNQTSAPPTTNPSDNFPFLVLCNVCRTYKCLELLWKGRESEQSLQCEWLPRQVLVELVC